MELTATGEVLRLGSCLREGRSPALSPCPFGLLGDPGRSALKLPRVGGLVEEQASGLGMCAVGRELEAAFPVLLGVLLLEEVSMVVVVEGWEVVSALVFLEMSKASSLGTKR